MEVNVFGLARLCQLVLPTMRAQKTGKIVNVTSMGGMFGEPFGAWYHATKFAVEGLSDCLRMELAPFGIDVIIVEPGAIRTEWTAIAAEHCCEPPARRLRRIRAAACGDARTAETSRLPSPTRGGGAHDRAGDRGAATADALRHRRRRGVCSVSAPHAVGPDVRPADLEHVAADGAGCGRRTLGSGGGLDTRVY